MEKNPAEKLAESLADASLEFHDGDMASWQEVRERTRQQMLLMLESFQKNCRAGHALLLAELEQMRKEPGSDIREASEYVVAFPENMEPLSADGSTLRMPQEIAGIDNERMLDFYDAAVKIYDSGRFEDAVQAAVFLTTMNPMVQAFWLVLALAYEAAGATAQAFDAYRYAIAADGETAATYGAAVNFCLRNGNATAAQTFVDAGYELLRAMPQEPWVGELSAELDDLQTQIDEEG